MGLNVGQWVVIGVCAILLGVYIRGYFYNRRRAAQISAWLVKGLKPWGELSAGEKLPNMATGGRMEIEHATAPFRKVEAVFLLAPRENPLFWIFYRLQGKHDELLLWVTFQSKPDQAVEVARPGDPQFTSRLKDADKPSLTIVEAPAGLQLACEEKAGAVLAGKMQAFVQRHQAVLQRLSLRANKPHLFVRLDPKVIQSNAAEEFISELSNLFQKP